MSIGSNTTEGIPNGATVTVANSGDGSGNAWDAVTIGASAALTSDNAHPAHGLQAHKFVTGASAVQVNVSKTLGAAATYWWRLYFYTPSSFATAPTIARLFGSGVQVGRVGWNASGNIIIRNSANTTVGTSTTALATGTFYRLEGFFTQGASSPAEIKLFASIDADVASATETLSLAAQNFGTNNIDQIVFGQVAALANMPAWWGDDFAWSTAGYIGPSQLWTIVPVVVGAQTPWSAPLILTQRGAQADEAKSAQPLVVSSPAQPWTKPLILTQRGAQADEAKSAQPLVVSSPAQPWDKPLVFNSRAPLMPDVGLPALPLVVKVPYEHTPGFVIYLRGGETGFAGVVLYPVGIPSSEAFGRPIIASIGSITGPCQQDLDHDCDGVDLAPDLDLVEA